MSASHGHSSHGDHGHGDGGHPPSTFKGYMVGFILSVILTVIPFWMVMDRSISDPGTLGLVLLVIAGVQVVVHMIYFLHMTPSAEGGWTMLALLFTAVILVIVLAGSVWVMYHMNINMMPGHGMHGMS